MKVKLEIESERGGAFFVDAKTPIRIGSEKEASLSLKSWRIAKKHAVIQDDGRHLIIEDLGTFSGCMLNGRRFYHQQILKVHDELIIGPYRIRVHSIELLPENPITARDRRDSHESTSIHKSLDNASAESELHAKDTADGGGAVQSYLTPGGNKDDEESEKSSYCSSTEYGISLKTAGNELQGKTEGKVPLAISENTEKDRNRGSTDTPSESPDTAPDIAHARLQLQSILVDRLDLRRNNVLALNDEALRTQALNILKQTIREDSRFESVQDSDHLCQLILDETLGLGPLEKLLKDPTITEIMVNRFNEIFIEANGRLRPYHQCFSSEQAVREVIDRIVSPLGRRIDESSPMVDARLADGSRVNAVIPPIAIKGSSLTIRKFPKRRPQIQDLIRLGSLSHDMAKFLETCVRQRMNMIVSGGTGSGKTTLLNVLSNCIPECERIITIEDAAELKLNHQHLINLEARPANVEGRGQVLIRDLVRNALRMRPDRIVVGECRGAEAFDMLSAMNTGHEGSLTTLHANTPRDALLRLETMILMAGMDLPLAATREHIASSIDFIVQQGSLPDGRRIISSITEIGGLESGVIKTQEIFKYHRFGEDAFVCTGIIPDRFEQLRESGADIDLSVFSRPAGESKSGLNSIQEDPCLY